MSFASDMKQIASELISEFGETLAITRESEGVFDATTGNVAVSSTQVFHVKANVSSYSDKEIDGNSILSTDMKLLVYSDTAPAVGDTVEINDVVYRIMSVQPVRTQATNIVYRCQIRA